MQFNDALHKQIRHIVDNTKCDLDTFFAGHNGPRPDEEVIGKLFCDILEGALYRLLEGAGDWGESCEEDKKSTDLVLRKLIKYNPKNGWEKI